MWLAAILFELTACTPQPHEVASPSRSNATLTRSQVVSDIDYALTALADMHPNLYWRSDPQDILRLKQELVSQLPEAPSALTIYLTFLRLTAAFNDAHVGVTEFPSALMGSGGKSLYQAYREAGAFPALFDPDADSLRLLAVPSGQPALLPGDEIVAINGVSAGDLLAGIEGLISGGAQTKHFEARREFSLMLWTQGTKAPFQVDIGPRGGSAPRALTLPATTESELAKVAGEDWRGPIEYRLLEDRIGLITFHEMTEPLDRFAKRLGEIFDQMATDHPTGLIIDIRRNDGGNSGLGDLLLAFVNDTPYRPFAERQWKVSRTCQDWYGATDGQERRYFNDYLAASAGQNLVSKQLPTRRVRDVARIYDGPVAALIGPGTISSAAILADAMKTFHLAKIFGKPISEPANMYGEVCQKTLPQTGVRIGAPSALFIRANGDAMSKDPIVPDVPIGSDSAGSSSDPDLDAARHWLKSQVGAS
jgi:C-terminal processing protease CtpA/Prc